MKWHGVMKVAVAAPATAAVPVRKAAICDGIGQAAGAVCLRHVQTRIERFAARHERMRVAP